MGIRTPDQPDGACHHPAAIVHGCDEPAPEGTWSCDKHAVEAWKRGQELIAAKDARDPCAPGEMRISQ